MLDLLFGLFGGIGLIVNGLSNKLERRSYNNWCQSVNIRVEGLRRRLERPYAADWMAFMITQGKMFDEIKEEIGEDLDEIIPGWEERGYIPKKSTLYKHIDVIVAAQLLVAKRNGFIESSEWGISKQKYGWRAEPLAMRIEKYLREATGEDIHFAYSNRDGGKYIIEELHPYSTDLVRMW